MLLREGIEINLKIEKWPYLKKSGSLQFQKNFCIFLYLFDLLLVCLFYNVNNQEIIHIDGYLNDKNEKTMKHLSKYPFFLVYLYT